MYADVFWDLKIHIFLRRSLAHNISLHRYIFFLLVYLGGLAPPPPPPPNSKKLATLLIKPLDLRASNGENIRATDLSPLNELVPYAYARWVGAIGPPNAFRNLLVHLANLSVHVCRQACNLYRQSIRSIYQQNVESNSNIRMWKSENVLSSLAYSKIFFFNVRVLSVYCL